MTIHNLILSAAFLAFASTSQAHDLTGHWSGKGTGIQNGKSFNCHFDVLIKADAGSLNEKNLKLERETKCNSENSGFTTHDEISFQVNEGILSCLDNCFDPLVGLVKSQQIEISYRSAASLSHGEMRNSYSIRKTGEGIFFQNTSIGLKGGFAGYFEQAQGILHKD